MTVYEKEKGKDNSSYHC